MLEEYDQQKWSKFLQLLNAIDPLMSKFIVKNKDVQKLRRNISFMLKGKEEYFEGFPKDYRNIDHKEFLDADFEFAEAYQMFYDSNTKEWIQTNDKLKHFNYQGA